MTRTIIGAQGEITFYAVEGAMPADVVPFTDRDTSGRPIISHSESGHHHVLERAVEMFRKPGAAGMTVLYALLDRPADLIQDAPNAHGKHTLPSGLIEFRIAREFDPFAEQARRVAD